MGDRIDGLVTVRSWHIKNNQLMPIGIGGFRWNKNRRDTWIGKEATADKAPSKNNNSGLYSTYLDYYDLSFGSEDAVGIVECRGQIQIHEDGLVRSEYAVILEVFINSKNSDLAQCKAIAQRYDVPVLYTDDINKSFIEWKRQNTLLLMRQHRMEGEYFVYESSKDGNLEVRKFKPEKSRISQKRRRILATLLVMLSLVPLYFFSHLFWVFIIDNPREYSGSEVFGSLLEADNFRDMVLAEVESVGAIVKSMDLSIDKDDYSVSYNIIAPIERSYLWIIHEGSFEYGERESGSLITGVVILSIPLANIAGVLLIKEKIFNLLGV